MQKYKKIFASLLLCFILFPNFIFEEKKVQALPVEPLIQMAQQIAVQAGPYVHNFVAWWSQVVASGVDQKLPEMWAKFSESYFNDTEAGLVPKPGKEDVLGKLDLWMTDALIGNNNIVDDLIANEIESMYAVDSPVNIPDESIINGSEFNYTTPYHFANGTMMADNMFNISMDWNTFTSKWTKEGPSTRHAKLNFDNNSTHIYVTGWYLGDNLFSFKVITPDDQMMLFNSSYSGFALHVSKVGDIYTVKLNNATPLLTWNRNDEFIIPASDFDIIPGSALDTGSPLPATSLSPEIYDLIGGYGASVDELREEIKTNRQLQEKILLNMLEEDQPHIIHSPHEPIRNPITGQLEYNHNVIPEDVIDNPWGIGQILERIWNSIKSIPTILNNIYQEILKIPEQLRTAWERLWVELSGMTIGLITGIGDLFAPLWGFLADIPIFLQGIWDAILGLPGLIIDGIRAIFIPEQPISWSGLIEPTEPLLNDKYPWLFPALDKLKGAYEEPFTDVYVDLVFPIPGTYKIINFQWLNSQRDSIRAVIRAFFWIFLIMFNIDMVYKLIRGNSLFYKTLMPSQIEVIKGGKK